MSRRRDPLRTTRRGDPLEAPAGTLLGRTKAGALTCRVDDARLDAPIYYTTVPTAWRLEVLVVESADIASRHDEIDRLLDKEIRPC